MNAKERAKIERLYETLSDAFDTLEGMSDTDLDYFENDEEEREAVPDQYAARKVMQVMQSIEQMLGGACDSTHLCK